MSSPLHFSHPQVFFGGWTGRVREGSYNQPYLISFPPFTISKGGEFCWYAHFFSIHPLPLPSASWCFPGLHLISWSSLLDYTLGHHCRLYLHHSSSAPSRHSHIRWLSIFINKDAHAVDYFHLWSEEYPPTFACEMMWTLPDLCLHPL